MTDQRSLILASSSKYRKALLEQLGYSFSIQKPEVDEEPAMTSGEAPDRIVTQLAHAKALAVASEHPNAIVIGSDQVSVFENEIQGKPLTRENNIDRLIRIQAQTHYLLTAVSIQHQGQEWTHLNKTSLTMRPLSLQQIESYVDKDQPWDCAGGYKIELHGISLFAQIETEDFTSIQGLPLLWVNQCISPLVTQC